MVNRARNFVMMLKYLQQMPLKLLQNGFNSKHKSFNSKANITGQIGKNGRKDV